MGIIQSAIHPASSPSSKPSTPGSSKYGAGISRDDYFKAKNGPKAGQQALKKNKDIRKLVAKNKLVIGEPVKDSFVVRTKMMEGD